MVVYLNKMNLGKNSCFCFSLHLSNYNIVQITNPSNDGHFRAKAKQKVSKNAVERLYQQFMDWFDPAP